MKRSKIFLGISAVCLAAVGIAATKVQSATNSVKYHFGPATGGTCAVGLVTIDCPNNTGNFCKQKVYTTTAGIKQVSSTIYTLYTTTTNCVNRILTQ